MSDRQVVYVGIDVSKDSLSVDAGALFKGDVPNTPAGIRSLVRKIRRRAGDGCVPHFCFESTGPYSESLFIECCGGRLFRGVNGPAVRPPLPPPFLPRTPFFLTPVTPSFLRSKKA